MHAGAAGSMAGDPSAFVGMLLHIASRPTCLAAGLPCLEDPSISSADPAVEDGQKASEGFSLASGYGHGEVLQGMSADAIALLRTLARSRSWARAVCAPMAEGLRVAANAVRESICPLGAAASIAATSGTLRTFSDLPVSLTAEESARAVGTMLFLGDGDEFLRVGATVKVGP